MAAELKYSTENPRVVALWIRYEGRKSNREIAAYFEVSASTISAWRGDHPLFDRAIIDPNGAVSQHMVDKLFELMESDSELTVNNAINSLIRLGFGSSKGLDTQIKEEIERQLDKADTKLDESKGIKIYNQWKAKELTSGEAEAKLQFAGLPVPKDITDDLELKKANSKVSEKMKYIRELSEQHKLGLISSSLFEEMSKSIWQDE